MTRLMNALKKIDINLEKLYERKGNLKEIINDSFERQIKKYKSNLNIKEINRIKQEIYSKYSGIISETIEEFRESRTKILSLYELYEKFFS